MSTREKTKTLYSRNGIRIIKTENIKDMWHTYMFNSIDRDEMLEKAPTEQKTGDWVEHKCVSPLGFYYYKRNWERYTPQKPKSVSYRKHTIWLDTTKYELEYPIKYYANGTAQMINIEMRPWDILPGYKGMPDNMINALVQEVNKFLDVLFEYRNSLKMIGSFNDVKKLIMRNLFGYEDGPKIQPNNIKILSHGFDLKQSFRKRKES